MADNPIIVDTFTIECVKTDRLHPALVARLSREESVVDLFRPLEPGAVAPSVESSRNHSSRDRIREVADEYLAVSGTRVNTPHLKDKEVQDRFADAVIPVEPVPLQTYLERIVPAFIEDSTRVACSRQIGHMTGSLPNYLPPLAELVTAMNQNVVKSETSKTVTLLEKQVTACIHRLIFDLDTDFYDNAIKDTETTLGMFCSGGTVANITGLWVARNCALPPDPAKNFAGCEQIGILAAALHYGYRGAVVIGSMLMHYSFKKAADVLGIGVQGLVTCEYDENYRVKVDEVEKKLLECKANRICVIAVVGVAGATETGSIDDLEALAALSKEHSVHFHVDAAWGGPSLFSTDLKRQMKGIESADSVTVDGHKQLFMPMGCGMLLLKDPSRSEYVQKTANYIIRKGSNDLGRFTLEGSRPANAVYMHANLSCIGTRGYEALLDRSVRVCRYMAETLRRVGCFEVLFQPMLNILLYRYVPKQFRDRVLDGTAGLSEQEWAQVDEANERLQEKQKSEGHTFVSRTTVYHARHSRRLVALRVVIGNPVTEERDIDAVIADQLRVLGEQGCLSFNIAADPEEPKTVEPAMKMGDQILQEEYWQLYWDRMPHTARQFFLDDSSRFRAGLIAPATPSALTEAATEETDSGSTGDLRSAETEDGCKTECGSTEDFDN